MGSLDQQIEALEQRLAMLRRQQAAAGVTATTAATADQATSTGSASLPLAGIRIIDLTRFLAGPICTQMLGDMGAEVIKVEPLEGDPIRSAGSSGLNGQSLRFLARNRNKKSLAVDLGQQSGREILRRLINSADVFVENFRPGVAEKLGFGYEQISRENPNLIYSAMSGYGREGPWRDQPGQDLLVQAVSGMVSLCGWQDGPPAAVGTYVADMLGGFNSAYGIVLALLARQRLGIGQRVDVALLDCMVALQAVEVTTFLNTGEIPKKAGAGHGSTPPLYRIFEAREGAVAVVGAMDEWWQRLCKVEALSDICSDARFASTRDRMLNEGLLNQLLEARFRMKPATEWLALFAPFDVLAAPVNTYTELFADAQLEQNQMVVTQTHPVAGEFKVVGVPVKLSGTPGRVGSAAPLLGEHTSEILISLGYTAEEIARLKSSNIVAATD